nr:zinc finger, CCHC-type [Tanacetum cinerariifolium]
IKRDSWPHAHEYGFRDPTKSGTSSCTSDAQGFENSVCPASRTEAFSDYERFSLFMGKTVNELHAMLKLHEQTLTLPKSNTLALHAIRAENPSKNSICHECREIGHWKRNCPQYLVELMKKKKNAASGAGGS